MFKNGMLLILKGLFDRIKTYVDGKFAAKSTVYTKTETDTTFYKRTDAIDAATLGQKSLSQIETEQAAARTTLQNTIMTALANNVERIGNHVIVTSGESWTLQNLLFDTFGGNSLSQFENGRYQIIVTSQGSYNDTATVTHDGDSFTLSNGDYLFFIISDGVLSDVEHRNDLTNETLTAFQSQLSNKADVSWVDDNFYNMEEIDNSLSNYYTQTEVDTKIDAITGAKVVFERTMFWNGTTNYSLSELKDIIIADPFYANKKGYYMVNISAHWSVQDANFANSTAVMNVSLGNGSTSAKYGDKIELYFDGTNWSLEAVHASVHTTWINKLKADTDFQLAQLQTDLFAYVDAAIA